MITKAKCRYCGKEYMKLAWLRKHYIKLHKQSQEYALYLLFKPGLRRDWEKAYEKAPIEFPSFLISK